MQGFLILAEVEAKADKNLFASLGIDWTLLVIQAVAFLVLMWFLGKYVYPPITRMLEKRDAEIERASEAAAEAEANAAKTELKIESLLKKARQDAAQIVTTAKDEAANIVDKAEAKSKKSAERILEEAQEEIAKEISNARKVLHNETIDLVALATEKVATSAVNDHVDNKIIAKSISQIKNSSDGGRA